MRTPFRIFAIVFIVVSVLMFWQLDGFKSIDPHFVGRCTIVNGVGSAEDIQIDHRAEVAFISVYDRLGKIQGGSVADGSVVVYDLNEQPDTFNIKPIPELSEFRPHGLSLYIHSDGSRRLYVINHRSSGQDTVEVFDIDRNNQLRYRNTISNALFESANDIVAIGPDQFYVANDSGAGNGFMKGLEMSGLLALSKIVYYDRGEVSVVVEGFDSASGINANADASVVYISATNSGSLEMYQRDLLSGDLSHVKSVDLDMAVDNIDVAADGSVWVAGHPKVVDLIRHFISQGDRPAPSQVYVLPMDNGSLGDPIDIFTSMGEDLSASSVAAEHGGKIYIGGITPRKMLICEPG